MGVGAESDETRAPPPHIDTEVVDSLKVLDPKRPIREADIGPRWSRKPRVASDPFRTCSDADQSHDRGNCRCACGQLKAALIARLQDAKRRIPHSDRWATGSDIAALSLRHLPTNDSLLGCCARNCRSGRTCPLYIAQSNRKRIQHRLRFSGSICDEHDRSVQTHSNRQTPLQAGWQPLADASFSSIVLNVRN